MGKQSVAPFLACALLFWAALLATGTVGVQGRPHRLYSQRVRSLFVFGDSYADTGNFAKLFSPSWSPPYGITFPKKPAGRFSDGRVFTDYLSSLFGIRTPLPYKYRSYGQKLLPYGMNFAVGGSGVFDGLYFQDNLTVQIDHFQKEVNERVFPNLDLARSTAVVCISGNDYMFYEETGGTMEGLRKEYIPKLIGQLKSDLRRLHQLGIGQVAATSLHPIGCVPLKSKFLSYRTCNDSVNLAVMFHNGLLAEAVSDLNAEFAATGAAAAPFVIIDLYSAFTAVLNQEMKKSKDALKPCCRGVDSANSCGSVDANGTLLYEVCPAPRRTFYWDNVHPTQATWKAIFSALGASLSSLLTS